ncbi:MAG: hypothetical protein DIU79_15670 [Actinobacteria bacterium]|nr:MAG: hypothetical protein DIU79_15670 [Actinomycetota bacterium]
MATSEPDSRSPDDADRWGSHPVLDRVERRRRRIAEEIARNRRGEYVVPTWVLALTLALILAGWLALIIWG